MCNDNTSGQISDWSHLPCLHLSKVKHYANIAHWAASAMDLSFCPQYNVYVCF